MATAGRAAAQVPTLVLIRSECTCRVGYVSPTRSGWTVFGVERRLGEAKGRPCLEQHKYRRTLDSRSVQFACFHATGQVSDESLVLAAENAPSALTRYLF